MIASNYLERFTRLRLVAYARDHQGVLGAIAYATMFADEACATFGGIDNSEHWALVALQFLPHAPEYKSSADVRAFIAIHDDAE